MECKLKRTNNGRGWVMVFNPLSTIFQLYHGSQLYWWRKPEYPVKSTDLPQVRQTLSHNVVLSKPCHERGSNSQLQWRQALIAQVVRNPTFIRSWHYITTKYKFMTSNLPWPVAVDNINLVDGQMARQTERSRQIECNPKGIYKLKEQKHVCLY